MTEYKYQCTRCGLLFKDWKPAEGERQPPVPGCYAVCTRCGTFLRMSQAGQFVEVGILQELSMEYDTLHKLYELRHHALAVKWGHGSAKLQKKAI